MGRISRLLGENLFDPAELAARGEIRNIERDVTSKSGARRSLLVHLKAVSIQGGTVLYSCRDVTERKQAEEELRAARLDLAHASRLALVGELMASIAHEINQPLTAIVSNASAGLRCWPPPPATRPSARDPERHSRPGPPGRRRHRTAARPGAQASARAGPARRQRDRRATFCGWSRAMRAGVASALGRAGAGLPAVDADRVCLQQVLLNLVVNAMDAMDQVEAGAAAGRADPPRGRRRRDRGERHRRAASRPTACRSSSTRSSRPSERASASAWPSRARSSRRIADGSGPRTTPDAAPRSTWRCRCTESRASLPRYA